MPYPGHTTEEVARRGREIYERRIRQKVESGYEGKFVVIDITTGDYEIADDDLEVSDRMVERNPNAMLYGTPGSGNERLTGSALISPLLLEKKTLKHDLDVGKIALVSKLLKDRKRAVSDACEAVEVSRETLCRYSNPAGTPPRERAS